MFELHLSRDNKAKFYSHEGCYKIVDLCETKKKSYRAFQFHTGFQSFFIHLSKMICFLRTLNSV